MSSSKKYVGSLSPEHALLGLLSQHPAHGYDLHQKLVTDLGQIWHISQSQVYNILSRLETQKLIQGTTHEQSKLPARRVFRLTAAGRRRFEAWLNTPSGSSVRAIRVEFITRLYFAQPHSESLAQEIITSQVTETRAGLARLQECIDETPPEQLFNHLGLELRIRQLSSILDWLIDCQRELNLPVSSSEQR
jgi:PadR family transcriptional regulator AphA